MDEKGLLGGATLQETINKYYPLLLEARKRVFFAASVFLIGALAGFVFYEKIIGFVVDIFSLKGINIVFTSPFQFINLAFSCGFITGIVLAFPLIISQILSFLKPALRNSEYKALLYFLPFSIVLFLVGFSFGAFIMKWQIEIFLSQSTSLGIGNILDISRLLSVVLMSSAILGVGFQFPIVLLLLMKFKALKRSQIEKQRKWVYFGALVFAVLLPIDSILADILLAMPLVILFEVTLILSRLLIKE